MDLGFRAGHLLTFGLEPPKEEPVQSAHIINFYREVLDRIKVLPGVENAEVATGMPLQGVRFGMPFSIAGQPVSDPSIRPGAGFQMVTPEYYETFGIQILRGRRFTDQDSATSPRVAIVNEAFIRRFLQGVDPLQKRIVIEQLVPGQTKLGVPVEWQIVGVSRGFRNGGIRGEGFPVIDVPFQQSPWPGAAVVVRTSGDPSTMSKTVAATIHSISPDVPLEEIRTMDEIVDQSLVNDRFMTALYGSFAGVAPAAGCYRNLRRHGVRRGPAQARDRIAHCLRCQPGSRPQTCFERGAVTGRERTRDRADWRVLCRSRIKRPVLWSGSG